MKGLTLVPEEADAVADDRRGGCVAGDRFGRRDLIKRGAAAAMLSAFASQSSRALPFADVGGTIDPMTLVDPELRPMLQKALASTPAVLPPRPDRYRVTTPPMPFAASPPVAERTIPGLPGQPPVKVYVIGETGGSHRRPAILHIHGGGYVGFGAVHMVALLQPWAKALDCVIVTVEYRLAPETRLAGSLADNYAALRWLHASAGTLGVDPERIVVAGESAGGGHAAMLAIAARDRGGPAIRAQILTYPMLDDRTGSTRSVPSFIGTYVWTPEDNRYGWSSLLGVPAGSARAPADLIPGRVDRLVGLPPTFIAVGSLDLFAAEDMEYARRLSLAGVLVDLHVYPGAFHGSDIFVPEARSSRALSAARDAALRRAFGT